MSDDPIAVEVDNKCSRCLDDKCCTYITQSLDTPRAKVDFRLLLWQVSHQGVSIYKDKDGWFLLIEARCEHLMEGGGCGIYPDRPDICRDYSNDWCEFDQPAEEGFDLYFTDYASLLSYCRKRFKRWDG
jgi:Fe-S-cluster containining protein